LQTIHEAERILIPTIEKHDGILLKAEGDSFLVIFRNIQKAIKCAVEMQKILKKYNKKRSPEEQVLLCVGLGYGQMLRIGDQDVYGNEVNAASKLGEDTAGAYEILVTESVKNEAGKVNGVGFKIIPDIPPGATNAYKLTYKL
jgi:class 3 adenylate cyclase